MGSKGMHLTFRYSENLTFYKHCPGATTLQTPMDIPLSSNQ